MKKYLPIIAFFLFITATLAGNGSSPVPDISGMRVHAAAPEQPIREIELYPNPVTEGRLTLTASENIRSVQVLNITGKIVFNEEYPSGSTTITLDLDKLDKGVYLVRIIFPDNDIRTEKIMVK
jgi:hypothetical protein